MSDEIRELEPAPALPVAPRFWEHVWTDYGSFADVCLRSHPSPWPAAARFADRCVSPTAVLAESKDEDEFIFAAWSLGGQRQHLPRAIGSSPSRRERHANRVVFQGLRGASPHRHVSRLLARRCLVRARGSLLIHLSPESCGTGRPALFHRPSAERDISPGPRPRRRGPAPIRATCRVMVPEPNATRLASIARRRGSDRSRIHLDRPRIKIASRTSIETSCGQRLTGLPPTRAGCALQHASSDWQCEITPGRTRHCPRLGTEQRPCARSSQADGGTAIPTSSAVPP